jgi:hypothetical protein
MWFMWGGRDEEVLKRPGEPKHTSGGIGPDEILLPELRQARVARRGSMAAPPVAPCSMAAWGTDDAGRSPRGRGYWEAMYMYGTLGALRDSGLSSTGGCCWLRYRARSSSWSITPTARSGCPG